MSQALYRKWRPHLWDEVVGQEHVVHTLQNAIRSDRVGHAYLFAGPRGTGKTTTARLLAKAVNCLEEDVRRRPCDRCAHCKDVNDSRFLDLIEIDAASNTSVDDVRQLRETVNFAPSQGRFKVYIIDEVHMLSTAAFNALLKTLEEPPPHAIFILATTEAHKIPATVLSRCQRHEFRRIPVQEIVSHLREMCKREKIQVDEDSLVLIARQATGSLRDAISLLDQLASTGEPIQLSTAQQVLGTATSQAVVALVDAVLARDAAAGLDCIHQSLDSGTDPRQFARQAVDYLRGLLLIQLGNPDQVDATAELRQQMAAQAKNFEPGALLECIRLFNTAASETRGGWQPGLLLELALADAVTPPRPPAPVAQATPPEPAPAARTHNPPPQAQAHNPPADTRAQNPAEKGPARSQARAAEPATASTPQRAAPPPAVKPAQPAPSSTPRAGPGSAQQSAQSPAAPNQNKDAVPRSDFVQIQKEWERIKAAAKGLKVNVAALLNSGSLVTIKEGALVLGFSTEMLKQKMEAGDNLKLARQAIHKVTGLDLPVVCVVLGARSRGGSELDVEGDGIVGTALNMGGHIVQKGKTE